MDGGPGSERRPPLYIFHLYKPTNQHFESLEKIPEDDEDDNENREPIAEVEDTLMAEAEDNQVMEDVIDNPVIVNDDIDEDEEEDDEWDHNPYNFVDVSDTGSETGSNVDPDIFYSIIDFDKQFEEEMTKINEDQIESLSPLLPQQDSSNNLNNSNNDNHNNSNNDNLNWGSVRDYRQIGQHST